MGRQHYYSLAIRWTGNQGTGTSHYRSYERNYSIMADGKKEIQGSSDPAFRGDKTRHNPEELLVASLSSCHMLSYLHLCSEAGIIVLSYDDHATGMMEESSSGEGRFKEVTLNPIVVVSEESMIELANHLHKRANELCFIANSVNFNVLHNPSCEVAG